MYTRVKPIRYVWVVFNRARLPIERIKKTKKKRNNLKQNEHKTGSYRKTAVEGLHRSDKRPSKTPVIIRKFSKNKNTRDGASVVCTTGGTVHYGT